MPGPLSYCSVKVMGWLAVKAPALVTALAVMVSFVEAALARELPERVSVELPLPGAGSVLLLKEALTPAGRPLMESVTDALRPPTGVTVTVVELVLV